jgi:MFS family permease
MTGQAAAAPTLAPVSGLRHNRDWHRLWLGQSVSVLGDFVFDMTVLLWVGTVIAHGRSWAPLAVSGVLIAAALPVFLVGPVAGVVVDRMDRRRLMLGADLVRAALIAAMLVVPAAGDHLPVAARLTVVYLGVMLTSAASQFFGPARIGVVANVIPQADRPRAIGLVQTTSGIAGVVGPPLAAPLLFASGVQWALIVDSLSFVASFFLLRSLRAAPQNRPSQRGTVPFSADFRDGVGFFFRTRTLRTMLVSVCVYTLGVGALNVLDVFFVTQNLHADASWLGVVGAGFAVGGIVGGLLSARVIDRLGDRRTFWVGMSIAGLLILAYSRTSVLAVAVVVLGITGIPVAAVNVVGVPLLLKVTPKEFIGRVITVMGPIQQLTSIIGMLLAGYLVGRPLHSMNAHVLGVHFGPVDTVFGVSALLMISGALWAARGLTASEEENLAS